MRWFGFGFNAFGQICLEDAPSKECNDRVKEVNIITPTELTDVNKCEGHVKACWSRRASLHSDGKSNRSSLNQKCPTYSFTRVLILFCLPKVGNSCCLSLSGFGATSEFCNVVVQESRGCRDVSISDSHLVLAFKDKLESWDLRKEEKSPTWRMEIQTENTSMEFYLNGLLKWFHV